MIVDLTRHVEEAKVEPRRSTAAILYRRALDADASMLRVARAAVEPLRQVRCFLRDHGYAIDYIRIKKIDSWLVMCVPSHSDDALRVGSDVDVLGLEAELTTSRPCDIAELQFALDWVRANSRWRLETEWAFPVDTPVVRMTFRTRVEFSNGYRS